MPSFQKDTLFHCILEELFVCSDNRPVSGDKGNFMKISSYIQENYAGEISIGALAEIFGMSPNQLYYLFTKHTDMGPGDYLIAYRLNRARELLLTTDLFVHETANAVGYEDALYFSRIFKQRFGDSAQQLRKGFRNNP
jgi:transcriptional regulator GlxA family with amidase domain